MTPFDPDNVYSLRLSSCCPDCFRCFLYFDVRVSCLGCMTTTTIKRRCDCDACATCAGLPTTKGPPPPPPPRPACMPSDRDGELPTDCRYGTSQRPSVVNNDVRSTMSRFSERYLPQYFARRTTMVVIVPTLPVSNLFFHRSTQQAPETKNHPCLLTL